jgi:hypothetical protein
MRPVRIGCSLDFVSASNYAIKEDTYRRLYHIPIIKKFPGTIGASRTPRRTLRAMSVSKFLANPVPIRTIPQII